MSVADRLFQCPRREIFVFAQVAIEYDFDSLPPLGDKPHVLDLGANVGAFALYALAHGGKGTTVDCYEPHPETCAILRGNVEGLPIAVHEAAVVHPQTADRAPLFEGASARTECSLRDDLGSQRLGESVDVSLVDAADLPPCAMLKVDTEGAELPILTGYRHLAGVRVLLVECHGPDRDAMHDVMATVRALARAAGLFPLDTSPRGTTLRFARMA